MTHVLSPAIDTTIGAAYLKFSDGPRKLTSRPAARYGTVVVEDLNVAGMLNGHKLARHLADAGFAEIRRRLDYKTRWNGGTLDAATPVTKDENLSSEHFVRQARTSVRGSSLRPRGAR
jgi:IS605 OrfB family transposase